MTIYTVGYAALGFESHDILNKLKKLSEKHKAIIIDVRARPYGLINLAQLKIVLGVRYRWMMNLGNPKFKETADKEKLPFTNIIFMCAERSHKQCHRMNVAEMQQKIRNKDEEIIHLFSTATANEQRWDAQKTLY